MSPVDQYIMSDPDWFFRKSNEEAFIDPDNPYILTDHVKCACFELPFTDEELGVKSEECEVRSEECEVRNEENVIKGDIYGENAKDALLYLEEAGIVRHTGDKWHWADRSYPAEGISLRSAGADNVVIIDVTDGRNIVIGELDRQSAKEMLFEKAVYIHRGKQYMSEVLDIENRKCLVREHAVDYYTDGVKKTDIKILTQDESFSYEEWEGVLSDVLVRSQMTKFKKIKFITEENVGHGEINLPGEEIQTRCFVLIFPPATSGGKALKNMEDKNVFKALYGLGTLIRYIAPLFLLCDSRDLGIAERVKDPHFDYPALYIFDKYPGGTGLAENLAFRMIPLLAATLDALSRCPCKNGCPSCVGAGNKEAAKEFFNALNP